MKRFTLKNCIAHRDVDTLEFVKDRIYNSKKTLLIGTVGIDANSLYYPNILANSTSIDYKFLIEKRPSVSVALENLGKLHYEFLSQKLINSSVEFKELIIIADDGATVAGRKAVSTIYPWLLQPGYTDIVIDATGMSRGTCFPIVKQAVEVGIKLGIDVHLLIASGNRNNSTFDYISESNDRAEWMHGFQCEMDRDSTENSLKLWMPQLCNGKGQATSLMFTKLKPSEVCPIIPFPSENPHRGDNILFEHKDALEEWESSYLNIIYAHESNPLDVYRAISSIHKTREQVFFGTEEKPSTILSPAGWRVGSLGMLLASIELDLPILYVETIGYTTSSLVPSSVIINAPNYQWHIWLTGDIYTNP